MTRVIALQSMEHSGPRRRGEVFEVSPQAAAQLAARGLVRLHADRPVPSGAAGTPSSASPAAQVLPQTTAKPSGRGGKRKKAAE